MRREERVGRKGRCLKKRDRRGRERGGEKEGGVKEHIHD
jgi:hypothetical protein